ncbi:MAG: ABC transporter ATP-binding protein [Clostridia bacterium]|nr:ABC transporter ATP-binding protein [Clostridia bacterium]
MKQIDCKNVTLGYEGRTVCEGISFSVESGDYLCIVGDNGSGKSTLMKALLRLKAPDKGEICLLGGVTQSDIGYLPQRNDAQRDFPATVAEVVRSGCVGRKKFRLFIGRTEREAVSKNMRCMRISELAKRPFSELSGGQQQRVLLARALCAAEKILLLDEPVSGLDPTAAEEMYGAISHLNRDHGTTIIMITHDLSAVSRYATKVLSMSDTPDFYESADEYCRLHGLSRKEEDGADA